MTRQKPKDLMHLVTYKRENGKFDVNWSLNEERSNWVLPKVLRNQAKKLGKKPFLQFGYKKPLSFYQTNRLANRVANALCSLGVEKQKKVAVYMPNSDDYVITWFGILKMGAVMVPINTAYKMDFLEYIITSSDAEVLFIAEEYLDRMPPIAKQISGLRHVIVWTRSGSEKFRKHGYRHRSMISYSEFISSGTAKEPDVEITFMDYARLMYTSGTTGRSKGVLRPSAADYSSARNYSEIMDIGPRDVCFTCLPLFHSNAMVMTIYPALIKGAKAVVEEKYSSSRFWKWMVDHRVTKLNTVGTMSYFLW
ncbi:MAG: AMP-binding protein, partial [Candidatus Dadabacteria bacterium]|nr:AMP-binding protein [Candidatus Dadabacteria bacterium]